MIVQAQPLAAPLAAPQAVPHRDTPPWPVWALRLSGFSLMPVLLVAHPGFGHSAFFAVVAATAAFVPVERAVERRLFPPRRRTPETPTTRHLHLVEPATPRPASVNLLRREPRDT